MALSNDVCLRGEWFRAQESQAAFGAYCLSLQFMQRIVHDRACLQSMNKEKLCAFNATLSSSLVRSLALALSPPMMDPTHRPVGRSQATTDAQNRVGWVHQSLGFRHAVTQDARMERDGSRRGSPSWKP